MLKVLGQQLSTTHHLMKCDFTHSEKHQLREIFSSVSYNIFNIQSLQVKPVSFYIFILFNVVHSCFFFYLVLLSVSSVIKLKLHTKTLGGTVA